MKRWERFQEFLDKGDWHVHSSYTDGKNTVLEMCEQAVKNHLSLIAFTEHVRRELNYDFNKFISDIEEARKKFPALKILAGCEAKVLDLEGNLDVSEEILKKCNLVLGVFHTFPFSDKPSLLTTLKNLLKNPELDVWAHPATFLQRRELKGEETEEIAELCVKNKVLVEKSLQPKYTVPEDFLNLLEGKGVKLVVGSDAHSIGEIRT